jgi:hypothetical protein
MSTKLGYINYTCPACLERNFEQNWEGECSCGYQFPLSFIIDYASNWKYSNEFIEESSKYLGLRLSGKYIGKHPNKLKSYRNTKHLSISRYKGFDFSFLSDFKDLTVLELDYLSIDNLEGIELIDNLKSIQIIECKNLSSISSLTKIKLELLSIIMCNKITNFTDINSLTSLRYLSVEGKTLDNVDFTKVLTNLEYLNLNSKITHLNPDLFLKLKRLKRLYLKKTGIKKDLIAEIKQKLPYTEIIYL